MGKKGDDMEGERDEYAAAGNACWGRAELLTWTLDKFREAGWED